jgi:hypothetical protein
MDADLALAPPLKSTIPSHISTGHTIKQIGQSLDDKPQQVFCKRELAARSVPLQHGTVRVFPLSRVLMATENLFCNTV